MGNGKRKRHNNGRTFKKDVGFHNVYTLHEFHLVAYAFSRFRLVIRVISLYRAAGSGQVRQLQEQGRIVRALYNLYRYLPSGP
jgi:hypothetical protein